MNALRSERLAFVLNNRQEYGDIVYFRLGPRHVYQINHPDLIQTVLVKEAGQFHKSPALKQAAGELIGQGLLLLEGEEHRRHRRLVQPAFHHNRISAYADVMVDYTTEMIDSWRDWAELDVAQAMMKLTMRIVAKTLFDTDVTQQAETIGAAITTGLESTADRVSRPLRLYEWLPTETNRQRRAAQKLLHQTILGIINQRRRSAEDRGDLLSMLMQAADEDGSTLDDRQLHDEVMTLFIAGHETTANALAWTLLLLGEHPDVEARLHDEIGSVLGSRRASVTDLPALPYTHMVLKESMRLYPPAWIITRQAIADVELGGYTIPSGSIVMLSPYVVHRDPRFWEDPERFQPERFAAEREAAIPRYAYFPFGGGPRICVGNQFAMMEAALVLATMMQRVHLERTSPQAVIPEPLVTLRPRHGLPMRVKLRQPALQPTPWYA
jgi:cytochrome P450